MHVFLLWCLCLSSLLFRLLLPLELSCCVGFPIIHFFSWILFLSDFCLLHQRDGKGDNRILPHICTHMEATLVCFHNAEKYSQKSVRKHIRNTTENTMRSNNYCVLVSKIREKKHFSLPLFLSAFSNVHKAKWDNKKWVITLLTFILFYISVRGRTNGLEIIPDHQLNTGIRSTSTKHWLGARPQVPRWEVSVSLGEIKHTQQLKRKLQLCWLILAELSKTPHILFAMQCIGAETKKVSAQKVRWRTRKMELVPEVTKRLTGTRNSTAFVVSHFTCVCGQKLEKAVSKAIHQKTVMWQREYKNDRIGMLLCFLYSGKQHNMINAVPVFSEVVSAYELMSIEIQMWV